MLLQQRLILNQIFKKKIIRIIKYFNIFYYNIYIWIYIIILVFILFKKKNIVIYNKYKYLINFLFIILLLNKCQKSNLN
nr:hypothetical protein [Plasmodium sp.]